MLRPKTPTRLDKPHNRRPKVSVSQLPKTLRYPASTNPIPNLNVMPMKIYPYAPVRLSFYVNGGKPLLLVNNGLKLWSKFVERRRTCGDFRRTGRTVWTRVGDRIHIHSPKPGDPPHKISIMRKIKLICCFRARLFVNKGRGLPYHNR